MSMSAALRDIATPMKAPRHSVCTVTLYGVEFDCLYEIEGEFHKETRDMPAEYPTANLIGAFIGGVDVMPMVEDREWQGELESEIEHKELRK